MLCTSSNEQIHSVTSTNDVNDYEEFTFGLLERGTSVPSSKWYFWIKILNIKNTRLLL